MNLVKLYVTLGFDSYVEWSTHRHPGREVLSHRYLWGNGGSARASACAPGSPSSQRAEPTVAEGLGPQNEADLRLPGRLHLPGSIFLKPGPDPTTVFHTDRYQHSCRQ